MTLKEHTEHKCEGCDYTQHSQAGPVGCECNEYFWNAALSEVEKIIKERYENNLVNGDKCFMEKEMDNATLYQGRYLEDQKLLSAINKLKGE